MPFPELEKYKRQSPRLANSLTEAEVYLREVLDREVRPTEGFDHPAFDIVPVLLAKSLGVDEGYALTLLRIFEEAGIIVHRYDVYCPNTENFITSFYSKHDLPEHIECPFEVRTEHSIDEYHVELIFQFAPTIKRDHKLVMPL
jgi:hypothetical protein